MYTLCLKNIPDICDCNLKTNYQILIIFGTNIPDTTCQQLTIQFSTSLSVCFCTTWGKHIQGNITFYQMRRDCLNNITHKNTFCLHFDTLADISSSCPFFNCLQQNCLKCLPTMRTQSRRRFLHSLTAVSIKFCSRPRRLYQSLLDSSKIPKLHLVNALLHNSQTL